MRKCDWHSAITATVCVFALYTGSASGLASFDLNIGSANRQDHCGYLSNCMHFDNCCLK